MESFYKSIISGLSVQLILPALLLLALLLVMMFVLWRAQKREDFDLANMLRQGSADGKESGAQLAILISVAMSSWVLMSETLNARLTDGLWYGYLITWSGSPALLLVAQRWNGVLPFSKPPTTQPPGE